MKNLNAGFQNQVQYMRLEQMFKIEFLKENLSAETKKDALAELIQVLISGGRKIDGDRATDVLLQREKLGSTGIGDGVAIPHGKVSDLDELVVAFGRSQKGIDFDAIDRKPVHLFFLLLAPENTSGKHLKALAKISKMMKMQNFRKKLMEAKTKTDLFKIIIEQDESRPT